MDLPRPRGDGCVPSLAHRLQTTQVLDRRLCEPERSGPCGRLTPRLEKVPHGPTSRKGKNGLGCQGQHTPTGAQETVGTSQQPRPRAE